MDEEIPAPTDQEELAPVPEAIVELEGSKTLRWEIWGRWLGGREIVIQKIETPSRRHLEFANERLQFDHHWDLWLESFPVEHPHRALQRRLEGHKVGPRYRPTLRLKSEEGVKDWNQPARYGRPRTGAVT